MLATLMPLQRLTTASMSVVVAHHPKRGETIPGQAARGSGALSGFVDILIEMDFFNRDDDSDRRRKLRAFARHPETPRRLVIEWTADGTDYRSHGTFADVEFHQTWQTIQAVLADAPQKLTRRQLLDAWPDREAPPALGTLWSWLDRAVAQGLACRDGSGRRNDPYYYWLPGQLEQWHADPTASHLLAQIEALRKLSAPPRPCPQTESNENEG
jgi:hypothetical protein